MKKSVELDVYPYIDMRGIGTSVYIGDQSDDPIEVIESWENILQAEIDRETVPNAERPIVVSSANNGIDEIMNTVKLFRRLADQLEAKIADRPIFMRDKWVAETDDVYGSGKPTQDFYITYDEYKETKNG
jgi:hypothetical protein